MRASCVCTEAELRGGSWARVSEPSHTAAVLTLEFNYPSYFLCSRFLLPSADLIFPHPNEASWGNLITALL